MLGPECLQALIEKGRTENVRPKGCSDLEQGGLEEPEFVGVVAHQDVLGLLIVVEHHLVSFAPDA